MFFSTRFAQIATSVAMVLPMIMAQTGPVFPVDYEIWDVPQDYDCSGNPTKTGQFNSGGCVNLSFSSGKFAADLPYGYDNCTIQFHTGENCEGFGIGGQDTLRAGVQSGCDTAIGFVVLGEPQRAHANSVNVTCTPN